MRAFLLLFVLLGAASPAGAADAGKLRTLEQEMSAQQDKQDQLDAAARAASKNIEDLRGKLIRATRTLQDKEAEQETLEDKQEDLTQEIAEKSKNASAEKARLAQMVSALVEMASRPPETLFLQQGMTADHIHRSIILRDVLPRIRDEAENEARDLATLYDLQKQLARQKKLVAESQENLQQQQHDLDQLISVRQGYLQRTEQQKEDIAKHLAALTDEAQDLRQLMARVSPEAKRRAAQKAPRGTVALKWPVAGNLRKHFGDRDADGVTSEGLTLAAPSGAPVVAPRAGRVVFAGPFRGYGKIVILQHADGYHTFLSGFGRIDAEMGQDVDAGEPLGVLPVKSGAKPELYFEWRHGDEPVNPLPGLS
ncbi:MAG: peptidoglycan DD-metalloendopeptidase family protein [Alphaproteobacteria bacterium]|nr:peptidoglycan DD-metalloendopeptidase family protein [Alphaproteobacteria bacterium]